MKDVLVGIFVDFMGTFDTTSDQEMDYIEMLFREDIEGFNFKFKRGVHPHQLANQPLDVYVFDFGGLLPGCDDMMSSQYRELLKQIEDHPNTIFLIWGALSPVYYKDELHHRFGEEKDFVNVVFQDRGSSWREKIAEWLKEG